QEAAAGALRILGGRGPATAGGVGRLYRDTPLVGVGGGTNQNPPAIIPRDLPPRHRERPGGPPPPHAETPGRRLMALAVRQLVERELGLASVEDDRADRFPAASLDRHGELGLFGAVVPPDSGGLGLDGAAVALIIEEIGRGSATVAAVLSSHL